VRDVGKTFCGFRKKHGALHLQGHANRTPTPLCRICPPSNTTTRLSLERFFTFVMTQLQNWLVVGLVRSTGPSMCVPLRRRSPRMESMCGAS
jgi:hypothetical protein